MLQARRRRAGPQAAEYTASPRGRQPAGRRAAAARDHAHALARHAQRVQVGAQHGEGGAIVLDEGAARGAARERLYARAPLPANRSATSRPSKEPLEQGGDHVEDRLAHLVGRGASGAAGRRGQPAAAPLAPHDPHRPASTAPRPPQLVGQSGDTGAILHGRDPLGRYGADAQRRTQDGAGDGAGAVLNRRRG